MTEFTRGTVVHHKVMGKGIALNEVKDGEDIKIEVRMANGHIEKFYPEELETDAVVRAREQNQIDQINQANEENAKRWEI